MFQLRPRSAGIFKAYPLLDDRNRILWSAKYPDAKAIKELEKSVPGTDRFGLTTVFSREYLLDMSCVYVDNFMEEKKIEPIRPGGKRAKDFEISAPMWAHGHIQYMPNYPNYEFNMWFDDNDGYPHEQWMPYLEREIKRGLKKNPHYIHQYYKGSNTNKDKYENMKDYPDLPIRRMYWYRNLTSDEPLPSQWPKLKDISDEG